MANRLGAEPPPKLRSSLLVQGIAYRLQERAFGGLKPATLRLLERIADDAAAQRQVATAPSKMRVSTGTVLIREWHGTKHQVTVLKDGFLYRTKRFHSLSRLANHHRQSLVGSAVLRSEIFQKGATP